MNKEPRLQFTKEERADPALEKPIRKADRAADKAEKAQAKIPKKKIRFEETVTDPATGKTVTRLRFEEGETTGSEGTVKERNRIYNEDCLKILSHLPDESIDLVIADPPYYRMKGDFDFAFQTEQEYLDWCIGWVRECHRVLKPTGAFYCWGSGLMIDKLSVKVLDLFDWEKRNLIVWDYATGRPGKAAYRYETEFLWFYSKPLHKINHDAIRIPYCPGQEKDKRKNPKGKTCGNVWRFPRVRHNAKEATGHPTQKPEQLSERMILASSNPKDLVFIPFAGSGSEILACLRTKRDFIATEINSQYVENIILPRMKKALNEGG